jgi:hypothetical protein
MPWLPVATLFPERRPDEEIPVELRSELVSALAELFLRYEEAQEIASIEGNEHELQDHD